MCNRKDTAKIMWEWLRCSGTKTKHKAQNQQTLLGHRSGDADHAAEDDPTATVASTLMVLVAWLSRRRRRYLLLALCSPVLIPFLCATFPLLCAAEVCIRLCRLRRRRRLLKSAPPTDDHGGDGMHLCEEGRCGGGEGGESVLLQRYLENQLVLALGSVHDCGDYDYDEDDHDDTPDEGGGGG
ncbi:uncharacterized protein LOC127808821 [Diospyros lotus]|uniref:uncharacterized protein LOC127808821 n=1 Tax=Diospyros lotus TaxID=55363 RepID=UPI002251D195|nr:uncharacterized protein LOC127808821 [Diospyros lotus]XP_052203429.1 uncharacterized protein LOC127808821 [Diospyros lotus]XP_052203430.1 uncharacterized protein LOC127808821 [Diospyros lotus]XP_052203431.1 uncharacterized protein LOC127808821 [Diospyros lotus]